MTTKIHYDLSRRILMAIAIFVCAVFGVFLCIIGFNTKSGTELSMQEDNAIDYTVQLKPNDFFEEEALPAGRKYIANLIDNFNINYKYNTKFTAPVTGEYTYSVVATISATDRNKTDGNSYWSRSYELYKSSEQDLKNARDIVFSHGIKVDYQKYNAMLKDFKDSYALSATGKLKVALVINGHVESDVVETRIPLQSEISISVPLSEEALEVEVDTNTKNQVKALASTPKINPTVLLVSRILGLTLLAAAVIMVAVSYHVGVIKVASVEYEHNIKKLLSAYDSIIVNVKTMPSLANFKVSEVENFEELLDAYNSVHQPINYHVAKNSSTFVIINENMAWKYVVRVSDYK